MTHKILTYEGEYVDHTRLEEGIFKTQQPLLFDLSDSVENLIKRARRLNVFNRKYFSNLKKCEMVEVKIFLKKSS